MNTLAVLKSRIRKFLNRKRLKRCFALEARHLFKLACRYNASVDTDSDIEKMQYTLLRETHVIEKGMSLRNPRLGFGQEKVIALIDRLSQYAERYARDDASFLKQPIETIKEYVVYTKGMGQKIPNIEYAFQALCDKAGVLPADRGGGVECVIGSQIRTQATGNFESLVCSRHSIRYFRREAIPNREQIVRALEIAAKTPSACNRQAWKTHVYYGLDSIKLLKWQSGCRGFEEEVPCSIVVTANLKGFLWHEVHQAYVDGGMYAMNLLNALHFEGFGTIPLSLGFESEKLSGLRRFGIPENEVPIVIIGVGVMEETFKVAVSNRKDITATNTWH